VRSEAGEAVAGGQDALLAADLHQDVGRGATEHEPVDGDQARVAENDEPKVS
jgi:hypothetical protein